MGCLRVCFFLGCERKIEREGQESDEGGVVRICLSEKEGVTVMPLFDSELFSMVELEHTKEKEKEKEDETTFIHVFLLDQEPIFLGLTVKYIIYKKKRSFPFFFKNQINQKVKRGDILVNSKLTRVKVIFFL